MVKICNHIGLGTNNPQKLIKFYTEKLGFKEGKAKLLSKDLMRRIFGISSSGRLTKLRLDRITLEIISPQNLKMKKRDNDISGYNHWGLGVKEKEKFCKHLKEKGVPIVEIESKGKTLHFVKDPEGNLVEIYETQ